MTHHKLHELKNMLIMGERDVVVDCLVLLESNSSNRFRHSRFHSIDEVPSEWDDYIVISAIFATMITGIKLTIAICPSEHMYRRISKRNERNLIYKYFKYSDFLGETLIDRPLAENWKPILPAIYIDK